MCLQRKVASVVEIHFGIRVVTPEGLGARRQKEGVALSPHREQWWFLCTEILLELGIQGDVASVIEEQVELDFVIAWPSQQCRIQLIRFWSHSYCVLDAIEVLRLRGFGLQEVTKRRPILCRGLLPVFLNRIPPLTQPFL